MSHLPLIRISKLPRVRIYPATHGDFHRVILDPNKKPIDYDQIYGHLF